MSALSASNKRTGCLLNERQEICVIDQSCSVKIMSGYLPPHVRKSGKYLLTESGTLGFGIRSTAHRIRNLTSDCMESRIHVPLQRLESSTWNPESTRGIQNPKLSGIPLYGTIIFSRAEIKEKKKKKKRTRPISIHRWFEL